jgi:hypothetical protein
MSVNGSQNGHISRNGNNSGRNKKKKWTIMVYLGGDNNLTPYCISVLQQLETVKDNEDVRVLACFDSNTPWPKGSRYLAINCRRSSLNNGLNWEIHNDLIPPEDREHRFKPPDFCMEKRFPQGHQLRTGVAAGLKRFIRWSMKENRNSDRFMLILYGHGPLIAGKTFLAKENPESSLRLDELKEVLSHHFGPGKRKLDILACQNCVMNGLETAYELRDQVDHMIGSQGLVLAAGWPYDKLMHAVVKDPDAPTKNICNELLKACARHLIDFAVMDRSSEQSVCDIGRLKDKENVVTAVSKLCDALQGGLAFKTVKQEQVLKFPAICNAVKLARLEAQSYWGETFVDLYDFCERLLKNCNEAVRSSNALVKQLKVSNNAQAELRKTDVVRRLRTISYRCIAVMQKIRRMVPASYYIGSELQYSHGISVFFPWSLPGEPYTFVRDGDDYILKTAFETYRKYGFAVHSGWADFLQTFYKATLRKVRRADRKFRLRKPIESLDQGLISEHIQPVNEMLTSDLQKSSSSTGDVDHDIWSNIKNYPRRNYLSPSDCPRKILTSGRQRAGERDQFPNSTSPPVSYLGWNISGIVAEVISKEPEPSKNGRPKARAPRIPANAAILTERQGASSGRRPR